MPATKQIRVSEQTRDRLAKLAKRFNQPSVGEAVDLLLSEHEQLEAERAKRLALSEERMAEINRRRENPLEDAVPLERMVDMLDERSKAER